jgi:FdhD/NarQ family
MKGSRVAGGTVRRRVRRLTLPGDNRPADTADRADLLAAELAEEAGLTLVGFLRGRSMNVYTGAVRIATEPERAGQGS